MSELKVNSIKGVGASAAAITVDNTSGSASANLTAVNSVVMPNGGFLSNRNLIINGAMQVAQRGTSSTTSGYGTVDRFTIINTGTDESPTQAQVDVSSGTSPYTLGFRKALRVTNGDQSNGAGAGDFIWIQQIIESQNIANSGWNYTSSSSYVTLSFWVKSSVAQEFKFYARTQDGTNKSYAMTTGSLSADTWTKVTKTIPGHSDLQFDNDSGPGFEINFLPFLGTDRTDGSVTENAWQTFSGSARTKDNTSTWYTTNDATFEITGVQIEVGSVATDFEHRSFAQELALCQRYYYQNYSGTQGGYYFYQYASTHRFMDIQHPVPMRTDPTPTITYHSDYSATPTAYHSTNQNYKAYVSGNYDTGGATHTSGTVKFSAEL